MDLPQSRSDGRSIGNLDLLATTKLAILCSRACPGSIIVQTLDVVRSLRETPWAIVSGFQSPTEQECLEILLRGEHAVIVCPARCMEGMRVPAAWKPAIAAGRMLITSPFGKTVHRATSATAEERNRYVVSLADALFIPHAAPGGSLDRLCRDRIAGKKSLWTIDDPTNAHLLALGAQQIAADTVEELAPTLRKRTSRSLDKSGRRCKDGLEPHN